MSSGSWPGGEPLLCLPRKVLQEMADDFRHLSLLDEFVSPDRILASFRRWRSAAAPSGGERAWRWLLTRGPERFRRLWQPAAAPAPSFEVPDHLLFKRLWAARVYVASLATAG